MEKFVGLLRGINVGGNKKVPMKELKAILEQTGFENVKTLLASGNVVFEASEELAHRLAVLLENAFGFSIPTLVFPFGYIKDIVEAEPFKELETASNVKCNVTFSQTQLKTSLRIPYESKDGALKILRVTNNSVFWVSDTSRIKTTEVMTFLEKEFGKAVTTRNYNTVLKLTNL